MLCAAALSPNLGSVMERNLSPILRQEIENFEKDAEGRRSAMEALQAYVKDLDSKTIHVFLNQISEIKETSSLSGEFIISLYEVLARFHGVKIVPMVDNIMESIIQTLASSAGSFPLHQACSRVVSAIARYSIEPTTPEEKKRHVICSLYEMVSRICQNVAVALDGKPNQTNSHMGLVMALAKRNALIVEAYARLLIQSGLIILNADHEEGNSQRRLSSIQMLNCLIKFLDPRSVFSELQLIIEAMEKCQSDRMEYVRAAAFEVLQAAEEIAFDKKSRYVNSHDSIDGSNLSRSEGEDVSGDEDHSPASLSPEPHIMGYFPGYESIVESPILTNQASQNLNPGHRSLNPKYVVLRSNTRSQRSRALATPESIKIFATPTKHIHSLQYPCDVNSSCSERQSRRLRNLSSGNMHWSPTSRYDHNYFPHNLGYDNESLCADVQFHGGPESVSSTEDLPAGAGILAPPEMVPSKSNDARTTVRIEKARHKSKLKLVFGLSFVLLAMVAPLFWINIQDDRYLVPT
ncbi:protein SINE1-like isoform X3 [Neltuma alba]|uniref:protein SINE1-like isoform X3 n=1 Tax=Neltuma alba TaxID=207710 RepID=UPI0010A531C5|nr:protein SINE1-like isoform X3 [Prosopis alba]